MNYITTNTSTTPVSVEELGRLSSTNMARIDNLERRIEYMAVTAESAQDLNYRIQYMIDEAVETKLKHIVQMLTDKICERFGDIITEQNIMSFVQDY